MAAPSSPSSPSPGRAPQPSFDAVRHAGSPATPADVHALVERARAHPFGLEFLRHGAPNAVAATFGVHAFLVDAARDHLAAAPPPA